MNLNDEQEAILELIAQKDDNLRRAGEREREIALRQAADRVQSIRNERDRMVALAARKGIPWLQIARRGLNTKNTPTAKLAAQAGELLLQAEDAQSLQIGDGPQKYAWSDGVLTVTLTPEDFAPLEALLEEMPTDPLSHEFAYDGSLLPVGADDDETWRHPVVRVVMTDRFRQEAIDWIKEQI